MKKYKTEQNIEMKYSEEERKIFFDALVYGKFDKVNHLITTSPDIINAKDKYGFTALHNLMSEKQFEMINLLLEEGANPNIKNEDGITPLHLACWTKNANILLKNGADINSIDNSGNTPLHILAGDGEERTDVIKFLVMKGANIGIKNNKGETPYDIAKLRFGSYIQDLLK